MGNRPSIPTPMPSEWSAEDFDRATAELALMKALDLSISSGNSPGIELLDPSDDEYIDEKELANIFNDYFDTLTEEEKNFWENNWQKDANVAIIIYESLLQISKSAGDIVLDTTKAIGDTGYNIWNKLFNGEQKVISEEWNQGNIGSEEWYY